MKPISNNLLRLAREFSTQLVLLCVLAVLVVGGIFFERHAVAVSAAGAEKTDSESLIVRALSSDDHLLGTTTAPVELVVYADLPCASCKTFFETTMPKLQSMFGDQIVVGYRDMPLSAHPDSRLEADAAECVYALGGDTAFWDFLHAVFSQPGYDTGLDLPTLASLAQRVGVSEEKVTSCVRSGASDASVSRDALEASVAGITQTPTVVLKSADRALIVQGDDPSQLVAGIGYLLHGGN